MGKRGPSATPTATLEKRGSWRGRVRKNEPQPGLGEPLRPSGMSEQACTEWDRLDSDAGLHGCSYSDRR